eukprot:c22933_g1_i1.p1 GENE.c22933_g1_i1~~c22933_g1_i1.p1  ORF type:complete len:105 (+),score=22.22 c22933_g1_i1:1-315(+)
MGGFDNTATMGGGELGPSKFTLFKAYVTHIPKVSKTMGIVVLILNIILPGIGSIIAGLMGNSRDRGCALAGVFQLLTAFFIVGWIWSIVWGIKIHSKANSFIPI